MPQVDALLRQGRIEEAQDCGDPNYQWPEIRPVDSWLIDTWHDMQSRLAEGGRFAVFEMRCRAAGFGFQAQGECWERIRLVDDMIAEYQKQLAKQQAAEVASG